MRTYIGILLISISLNGFSQNQDWVNEDEKLIRDLIKSYKQDSTDLKDFFYEKPIFFDTTQLGRNYYTVDFTRSGGYIGIKATYLYKNDTLIAYKLSPKMPNKAELINKYQSWYSSLFEFNESNEIIPIYFNENVWFEPLKEYSGKIKTENQSKLFKYFMSIESGDVYGYNNGWGGLQYNRKLFEELLPELNPDLIVLIMYSKNPISRLQAFHYYLTNKTVFKDYKEIEDWMNEVLMYHPLIGCSDTDVIHHCDPKEILMEYVEFELNNK
jgi:hypothetical protein